MKRYWIPLCFVIGISMLLLCLYYWGGLASHPEVGSYVRKNVSTYSFLAWAYSSAGSIILEGLGLQAGAADYAAKHVGHLFPAVKTTPFTAMNSLFNATPATVKAAYYLGPILIIIAAFAQSRQPKTFKTFNK